MNDLILNEFKENAIFRLEESLRMINIAFSFFFEKLLWKSPTEKCMALGNQILHSCGNITQYIISSLGDRVDQRDRELEFSTIGSITIKELLAKLDKTIKEAQKTIQNTSVSDYQKVREVQGFNLSGVGCVLHSIEHFSYHTGQIAFWVKLQTNKNLCFYDGIDLTKKNH